MVLERTGRTTKLSLAKAMKVKARLAGRLTKLQSDITNYNSTVKGRRDEVDVAVCDKKRAEIVQALIELKSAIAEGSRGIMRVIYEITERKAEVELVRALNTRNGTEPAYGMHSEPQEYIAVITKKDVDERIKKLETDIDTLQDRIDNYNSVPDRVEIDTKVLELVS